jgi:hypothetical protein
VIRPDRPIDTPNKNWQKNDQNMKFNIYSACIQPIQVWCAAEYTVRACVAFFIEVFSRLINIIFMFWKFFLKNFSIFELILIQKKREQIHLSGTQLKNIFKKEKIRKKKTEAVLISDTSHLSSMFLFLLCLSLFSFIIIFFCC